MSNACCICYLLSKSYRQCILCVIFALVLYTVYIYIYVYIYYAHINAKTSISHILVIITANCSQKKIEIIYFLNI